LLSLGQVFGPDRRELDLSDADTIRRVIRETRPQLIVNAAAYTAVDAAENDESNAYAINAEAPVLLAEEAKRLGALLVHYSTDYVFDGSKRSPYNESDETNPLNVYGKTKLVGDEARSHRTRRIENRP
jgi:dTDP-4-dehydrorhamnose reductase